MDDEIQVEAEPPAWLRTVLPQPSISYRDPFPSVTTLHRHPRTKNTQSTSRSQPRPEKARTRADCTTHLQCSPKVPSQRPSGTFPFPDEQMQQNVRLQRSSPEAHCCLPNSVKNSAPFDTLPTVLAVDEPSNDSLRDPARAPDPFVNRDIADGGPPPPVGLFSSHHFEARWATSLNSSNKTLVTPLGRRRSETCHKDQAELIQTQTDQADRIEVSFQNAEGNRGDPPLPFQVCQKEAKGAHKKAPLPPNFCPDDDVSTRPGSGSSRSAFCHKYSSSSSTQRTCSLGEQVKGERERRTAWTLPRDVRLRLRSTFAQSRLLMCLGVMNGLLCLSWVAVFWYLLFLSVLPVSGVWAAYEFRDKWLWGYGAYLLSALGLRLWYTIHFFALALPGLAVLFLLCLLFEGYMLVRLCRFRAALLILPEEELDMLQSSRACLKMADSEDTDGEEGP